jgi:hypothetical protein
MLCKQARKAIFEDGLGLLDRSVRGELERHCRTCATCEEAFRSSRILDDGFRALRSEPVPELAIRRNVLDRIGASRPAAHGGFAWGIGTAALSAAGFAVLTFFLAPHALPVLRGALYGAAALLRSTGPLWALVSVPIQAGSFLIRPVLALAEGWGKLQPALWSGLIAGSCLVLAASLVLVGRSYLRERPAIIRKEP